MVHQGNSTPSHPVQTGDFAYNLQRQKHRPDTGFFG
jgi:hypothetical protein